MTTLIGWVGGDSFKWEIQCTSHLLSLGRHLYSRTVYFFLQHSPLQFKVCAIFQLSIDLGMSNQWSLSSVSHILEFYSHLSYCCATGHIWEPASNVGGSARERRVRRGAGAGGWVIETTPRFCLLSLLDVDLPHDGTLQDKYLSYASHQRCEWIRASEGVYASLPRRTSKRVRY